VSRHVSDTARHERNRTVSIPRPSGKNGERAPLLHRRSLHELDVPPEAEEVTSAPLAGGTILGIHNLAIVAPQFIVSFSETYRIFKLMNNP
jgi:solute carrier family 45 protein 1/2/4